MIDDQLKRAFRWHMQAVVYRHGVYEYPEGRAVYCLNLARNDVARGEARYPRPAMHFKLSGKWREDADGLRYVGRVSPEFRRGPFGGRESEGWLTLPGGETYKDGTGLCFGVVYRLPGRKGESRYVAGYQFGGQDGGPSLDLSRVFADERGASYWDGSPPDTKASRAAARHADDLAKAAAEAEREYQTAWTAGSRWEAIRERMRADCADLRAILKERRAVKGAGNYPTLCSAIRLQVAQLWRQIHGRRERMRELAKGDSVDLGFWPGDARLCEAFNDGAGETVL